MKDETEPVAVPADDEPWHKGMTPADCMGQARDFAIDATESCERDGESPQVVIAQAAVSQAWSALAQAGAALNPTMAAPAGPPSTVVEAMRLLCAMEEGNRPWDTADQQTADSLRALIRGAVPPADLTAMHRDRAERMKTERAQQERDAHMAGRYGKPAGTAAQVLRIYRDPDPVIETALAQGAAARLQALLEGDGEDAYIFADAEGLWFTTFGGPTPARDALLTGGAMLREGMPDRVLRRLLDAVRHGAREFGLDVEEPVVVCESCGAFGWGDPCESLGWQAAATEEDGILHFCPRCRYDEEPAAEPKLAPDVVQATPEENRLRAEVARLQALLAEASHAPATEPPDPTADLPHCVETAARMAALPGAVPPLSWVNEGGHRWCVMRSGLTGGREIVDVLRIERAYDVGPQGERSLFYRAPTAEIAGTQHLADVLGVREKTSWLALLGTVAEHKREVARLSEALADAETKLAEAIATFEDAAQQAGRAERQIDACETMSRGIPATVYAEGMPLWSLAYEGVLRLRVRYEALRTDALETHRAYLTPDPDGHLRNVELVALRARGLEP